jgi:hypothetical protein
MALRALKAHTSTQKAHRALRAHTSTPQRCSTPAKPFFPHHPDVSHLPDVLEQKIATHQYHKAAVGARDSGNPSQGFTTYKVAVMLY